MLKTMNVEAVVGSLKSEESLFSACIISLDPQSICEVSNLDSHLTDGDTNSGVMECHVPGTWHYLIYNL